MRLIQLIKPILLLLPLLEIAGFIVVGSWIGVFPTLLLIIITTMLGFALLRVQGFHTLRNMQRKMAAGHYPQTDMLDNSIFMFGALLLIFPGFITDMVGLILLIPAIRTFIIRWLTANGMTSKTKFKGNTINGDFHRE